MTLQEAKEIVAKKAGFERWDNIQPHYEGRYFDEVAELYARSKRNEVLDQVECLIELYRDKAKPEFKP